MKLMILFGFLLIICSYSLSDSVLSHDFYTNLFTDNDKGTWSFSGNSQPSDHYFTECGGQRIFGGYKKFGGDPSLPFSLFQQFTGLIAHYGIRVQAKIYKIDSWSNQNLFVMIDNQAVKIYNFGQSNSTVNFCGDPYPVFNSINKNYNDSIILVDFNLTHNSSILDVSFQTDLNSDQGWWGIRDIKIQMLLCDKSCQTCSNSTACLTCDSAVPGLAMVGSLCDCTLLATIKQKITYCTSMPCVNCVGVCTSLGYYLNGISGQCQACHQACDSCTGPSNGINTICITCATGFLRSNPLTQPCFNCLGGCSACTALTSTSCTGCEQGYFLNSGQCLTDCPIGTYPQQKARQCYPCSSSCYTCDGPTPFYCTSCTGVVYLSSNHQCLPSCNPPFFKYNNMCLEQCPVLTYQDFALYVCSSCSINCIQCISVLSCSRCSQNYYLYLGICGLTCPTTHYPSLTIKQCVLCHTECLSCFGFSSTSCSSCSDSSKILISGTCYTSCPNGTYSAACLPCNESCLECSGPLQNNCLSCKNSYFLDLRTNKCTQFCQIGMIVDKINFSCSQCPNSMVGYFHECVSCSTTCKNCFGINFFQCSSCEATDSILFVSTCLVKQQQNVIKSKAQTFGLFQLIKIIALTLLILCGILELFFVYKTPLLPTIQTLQIIAYFYFYSTPMSQQLQRILYFFYYTNFTAKITLDFGIQAQNLPIKILMMKKTGFYAIDTVGIHIFVMLAIIILVLLKKLKSISKLLNFFHQKLNPYLMSYLYRLVILDQFFSFLIFIRYGNIGSTMGIISLTVLLIDFAGIALTFFWKIKPNDRNNKEYALFYFNEISQKYVKSSYENHQNQSFNNSNNNKKSILLTFLFYLGKIPFALAIAYFIFDGTYQTLSVLAYAVFFLIMMFLLPYKRKIYALLYILSALVIALTSGLFVAINHNQQLSISIQIVCLVYLLIVLAVTFTQGAVNHHFFIQFFLFTKYKFCDLFEFKSEQISSLENSQVQSQNNRQVEQNILKCENNKKKSLSENQSASIKLEKSLKVQELAQKSNISQNQSSSKKSWENKILTDTLKVNQKLNLHQPQMNKQENQNDSSLFTLNRDDMSQISKKIADQNDVQLDFDL